MRRYFADLWNALKGDGIALDKTEGAILGASHGETISLWAAMENRHGKWLAHIACVALSVLVQYDHCHKQLVGQPMKRLNYLRAFACLLVPIVLVGVLL